MTCQVRNNEINSQYAEPLVCPLYIVELRTIGHRNIKPDFKLLIFIMVFSI